MAEPVVTMTARVAVDKNESFREVVKAIGDIQSEVDGKAIVYRITADEGSLEKTLKKIQEQDDLQVGVDFVIKSEAKTLQDQINKMFGHGALEAEVTVDANSDSIKKASKDISEEVNKISNESKVEIDADTSKAQEQLKNLNKEQDKAQRESNESAKASQEQGKAAKDASEKIKDEAKAVRELADAQGRYKSQKGEVGDTKYSYIERKGFAQDDHVTVDEGNITHDLTTKYELLESEIKRVTLQIVDAKAKMDEMSKQGIKTDSSRENLIALGKTLHDLNEELDAYYISQKHVAGGGNRNALTEDLAKAIAFRKNEITQLQDSKFTDNLNLDKDYQLTKLAEYEVKLKELGLLSSKEQAKISNLMNILASADSSGMQKFNKELRNFQQEMRPAIQSTEQFNKAWDDAIKENDQWKKKQNETFLKDWDSAIVENNDKAINAYKELTRSASQYYDLQRKKAASSLTKNEEERLTNLKQLWAAATNGVKEYQITAGNDASYGKAQSARSDFLASGNDIALTYSQNLQKTKTSLEGMVRSGKYTTQLNNDLNDIIGKINTINKNGIDLNNSKTLQELGEIDKAVTKAFSDVKLAEFKKAADSTISKLNLKIEEFTKKNSRMGMEFRERFENLKLDWDTEHTTEEVQKLVSEFSKLEAEVTAAGRTGANFLDTVRERLFGVNAQLIAQYLSLQDIIRYVQTLARNVVQIDTALTELRKVSDASTSRLSKSFEQSAETAQELGRSITDVINSTADWSRAGFDVDAAEELARVSTLYQNVGDNIDVATANEHLVSALRGFHKGAEDAERIVDVYNDVANKFSIDTAGIGEALQRSASVFYNASTDLESAVALVTGANEIVQDPSRVGNAWKTISARIRASKNELIEMGEETENMFESTAKLREYLVEMTGVDILDEEGQFKNLKDIVVELGKAFETIDNEFIKQEVAEKLAGKTQMNVLLSAISNYKQIEKAYDTAVHAAGSAAREQENYAQSVQYSIDQLQASIQELSYDFLDSDLLKGAIEFTNTLVQGLDSVVERSDNLITALGGVAGALLTIKKTGAELSYDSRNDKFSLSLFGTTIEKDNELAGIKAFAAELDKGTKYSEAYKNTLMNCKEETRKYAFECVKANKSTAEMVDGFKRANKSGSAFSTILKTVGARMASLAINMGISLAISALVNVVTALATAEKELAEKTQRLSDEYNEAKKDIDGYKDEISQLYDVINDSNSTYDEAKSARERLLKIQDELIDKFGDEQGAITDVTDAINGQVDALDRLADKKWQNVLASTNQATDFSVFGLQLGGFVDWFNSRGGTLYDEKTDDIVRKMSDVSSFNPYINEFGTLAKFGNGARGSGIGLSTDDVKLLKELTKSYENLSFAYNENHKGYELVGRDMEQFEDDLQRLLNQTKQYGGSDDLNKFLSRTLMNVSKLNDSYGSFYDDYILNNKIATSAENSSALDSIANAVQEYNEAFNEGFIDDAAQEEAISKLASIWGGAMNAIEDDADVVGYVERLYPEIKHMVDQWQFELHFKANTDGFKDDIQDALELYKDANGGYISYDNLVAFDKAYKAGNIDAEDDRVDAYHALEKAAERYGLEVLDLIGILKEEQLVMSDDYNALVSKYGEANIASLSSEDLAIAETYANTMFGSFDALLEKIAAVKAEQQQLNAEHKEMDNWASERDAALSKLGLAKEGKDGLEYDESWGKYLDTIRQLNPELASNQEEVEKCALANLQFSHAVDDLSKNFDSYKSALQDANALTPEYSNAINALADDLTYLTGINFSISDAADFLGDVDNLNLLEQALKGSDSALQELQARAAEAIHIGVDFSELEQLQEYTQVRIALGLETEGFNAEIQNLANWINENSNMGEIDVTAALNENPFLQQLVHIMSESSETAAAVKSLFESLGWDVDWKTEKVLVAFPETEPTGWTPDGKNRIYRHTLREETIEVPTNFHYIPNGGSSGGKTSTSKYTPHSMSPSQKSGAGSNLGSGSSGGGGGSSSDATDKEDDYRETIDFFERLVKVLDQQIDLLDAHLQDVVGSFAKNMILDAEEDAIKKKMAGYSSAVEMYSQKAAEALSKIPGEIAEKVQSGAVAIDEFIGEGNKDVVDAINDYQGWADKVAECKQQIVELREALRQLELQKFNNIAQDFQELFDVRNTQIDLISKAITLFETSRDKTVGRAFYDESIEQTEKQLTDLYAKHTALSKQMTKAIAAGVNVAGDEWLSMVDAIEKVNAEILDAQTNVEKYKNAIIQLYVETFDNESNYYSSIVGTRQKAIDSLERQIALMEASGQLAGKSLYDRQINEMTKQISDLEAERNTLVTSLNNAIANGVKRGTDEWKKMVDEIYNVDAAIQETQTSIKQTEQAIKKLYLARFQKAAGQYDNAAAIRDKASSAIGNEITRLQTAGQLVGESYYQAQRAQAKKTSDILVKERKELIKRLNTAIKKGVNKTAPCYSNVA